jgi:DNA-binding SARP family transcriptional activator
MPDDRRRRARTGSGLGLGCHVEFPRLKEAMSAQTSACSVACCSSRTASRRRARRPSVAWLLALLAVAPGRTLSRDRLLASLWPEADGEQARHQLSVSVYELRRVLGEHVLVSRGDDLELAAAVTTDLDAFEAAVAAGEMEAAVALYAGPLMDGFHLSGSSELEHWLDGERDRLARAHAAAMERLAGERTAAGDVAGAADLWRRRAVLDPYNGRVALALMQALEQAGDRAGALQHARIHSTLLRESSVHRRMEVSSSWPPAAPLETRPPPRRAPPSAGPTSATPPEPAPPGPAPTAIPPAATGVAAVRPTVRPHRSLGEVPGPVARRLRRRRLYRRAGFVVPALMVIASIVTILLGRDDGGPDRVTAAAPPRIAVLPFQDLSVPDNVGRLGDAIADRSSAP